MTPATTALKRARIPFSVHEYEHDPATASYGTEAVERLGVEPERVFKTLITLVDQEFVVAMLPVARSLDLKALAAAVNGKRAVTAESADAERVTGYVTGGISPVGQRRPLRTVLDESALLHGSVFVSGGRRGLELELSPGALCQAVDAAVARISR